MRHPHPQRPPHDPDHPRFQREAPPPDRPEPRPGDRFGPGGAGPHRHHGRGPFDYGELRLLLLALIAEQPRHGYDLIRSVEERFGGAYVPSPGVIYPALAWLDDLGLVNRSEGAGRKTYALTDEGRAFLDANRAQVDELLSRRLERPEGHGPHPAVLRGFENLKMALKLRSRQGPLPADLAEEIGLALDALARKVEKSL